MFFIDYSGISSFILIIFRKLVFPNQNNLQYEKFKTNCIARFINRYGKQSFILIINI